MAKGLRSNNKKALRTVRRKQLAVNPQWQADAEAQRQEVLARLLARDKPPPQVDPAAGTAGMEVEQAAEAAAQPAAQSKETQAAWGGSGSDGAANMVTSTGKIHLTKKKVMKLKKKRAAGNDLWKQGTPMAFHNKRRKKLS